MLVVMPWNATKLILPLTLLASACAADSLPTTFETTVQPLIQNYCYACHNDQLKSGGLNLKQFPDTQAFLKAPETWQIVLRRLEAGVWVVQIGWPSRIPASA